MNGGSDVEFPTYFYCWKIFRCMRKNFCLKIWKWKGWCQMIEDWERFVQRESTEYWWLNLEAARQMISSVELISSVSAEWSIIFCDIGGVCLICAHIDQFNRRLIWPTGTCIQEGNLVYQDRSRSTHINFCCWSLDLESSC